MLTRKRSTKTARPDAAYLGRLAERIRQARAERGVTRAALAHDSGVSLRFLAKLESGEGNPSLLVMRKIANALDFPLESLISDAPPHSVGHTLLVQLLHRLTPEQLSDAHHLLTARFMPGKQPRRIAIALLGLRGAGKTTLGRQLAQHLGVRFVELDREVEREYGTTIGEILQLHGQSGYRRCARRCLQAVLGRHADAVIETGGGLATDPETLDLVLHQTRAVWVRASPEEHMQRVIEQGDLRPMAKSREAMSDLRAILRAREPFYSQAPYQLNTSGQSLAQSFADLLAIAEKSERQD